MLQGLTSFFSSMTSSAAVRNIDPTELSADKANFKIIDVRGPSEWTGPLGHIEGALGIPAPDLPSRVASWDRDQPIAVVCRSGGRSAMAARRLASMGFTQVYNMAGGMGAWNGTGLPVRRGPMLRP